MAQQPFAAQLTRMHTTNAGKDIHLELFQGELDQAFQYTSLFERLTHKRVPISGTNTYRIDRMGASNVMARSVGDKLDPQKVPNDKFTIVVDRSLYIQNTVDFMDMWTSPDRLGAIAKDNGSRLAKSWDVAHVIQLLKSRSWKAPAELKATGAFYDGTETAATIKATPANRADYEANAMALAEAHAKAIETMVKRDAPMQNLVTLVRPDVYSALMNHPTLFNKDFSNNNGDYSNRRVLRLNGVDLVEASCFPTAVGNHELHSTDPAGVNFGITADDLKYGMVLFDKATSLVDVVAKDWQTYHTAYADQQAQFLTVVGLRTVAARRPDMTIPIKVTAA